MPQPTILLVDDDRSLHPLVRAALASYQINLIFAEDAPEAIQLVHHQLPDLIVMDLMLPSPNLKGWDVISQLKNDARTRHIPIVAMTAAGNDVLARGMRAGADNMLQKPFSVGQLRQVINQMLSAV